MKSQKKTSAQHDPNALHLASVTRFLCIFIGTQMLRYPPSCVESHTQHGQPTSQCSQHFYTILDIKTNALTLNKIQIFFKIFFMSKIDKKRGGQALQFSMQDTGSRWKLTKSDKIQKNPGNESPKICEIPTCL